MGGSKKGFSILTHKIVIPIDGSDYSKEILSQVTRFFNPETDKLILLYVASTQRGIVAAPSKPVAIEWSMPMYQSYHDADFHKHPIYDSQVHDTQVAELKHQFQPELQQLEEAGFVASIVIKFGDPAQKILEYIKILQAIKENNPLAKLVIADVALVNGHIQSINPAQLEGPGLLAMLRPADYGFLLNLAGKG